ncbi:MAG: hypothetical protein ACRED0_10470 [Gammaproteobacteria bacterium]
MSTSVAQGKGIFGEIIGSPIGGATGSLVGISAANSQQLQTVESVATLIAQQHNAKANAYLDEMTVSNTAKAVGKNIIFTTVLTVKQGLSPAKLAEIQIRVIQGYNTTCLPSQCAERCIQQDGLVLHLSCLQHVQRETF